MTIHKPPKRPRAIAVAGGMAQGGTPLDVMEPSSRPRGPYKGAVARLSYEERLALRDVPQPRCKCGCGTLTRWLPTHGRWAVYVKGHYRRSAPYKDEQWLREQYITLRRTTDEIAAECGVGRGTIRKVMIAFGIERRSRSDARKGRKPGDKNPAWKGGIARRYPSDWKELRRAARVRDGWTCQDCGAQPGPEENALDVHHIDGDKTHNSMENLISLCTPCHQQRHRKEVSL